MMQARGGDDMKYLFDMTSVMFFSFGVAVGSMIGTIVIFAIAIL
jgi:hypothetical protein